MPIDKTAWLRDYKQGAAGRGEKWLENYVGTPGKLDAAKSDNAEKLYAAKTQEAIAAKRRQKALGKVSEADLNAAAQKAGSGAYTSGVDAKADKALKKVAPFLDEIDRIKPTLPAKTTDPMTNLTARAGPIVKGLSELKKRQG